jgi:hypothetical protein
MIRKETNKKSKCRQPFPYDRYSRKEIDKKEMKFVAVLHWSAYVLFLCSHRRRTERVCELLLAVVHRLLIRRDSEQDALDFLQD